MNFRILCAISLMVSSAVNSQTPPISPEEMLRCLSPDEVRVLVDNYSKAIADRAKPYIADQMKRGQLALQAAQQAEARYKHCMKVAGADLSHHTLKEPLPCGTERDAFFEARKRIPNFRSKEAQQSMDEFLKPIVEEENQRLEAEIKARCGK